jgi:hypothetical protein
MQLLVITLDNSKDFLRTLAKLKDHGMNGIVFPTMSLKHALLETKIDAAPIFGGLSKLVEHDFEASHTVLMLVHSDDIETVKNDVREITKGLGKKGIMFAMPVSFWEGIS